MKISWTNDERYMGTMNVEIRTLDDPLDMIDYCSQKGVMGCHRLITDDMSIITVADPFNEPSLVLETISHELLHSFTKSDHHQTPLEPRNQIKDDEAVQITTREISSFYDIDLRRLGKSVMEIPDMDITKIPSQQAVQVDTSDWDDEDDDEF